MAEKATDTTPPPEQPEQGKGNPKNAKKRLKEKERKQLQKERATSRTYGTGRGESRETGDASDLPEMERKIEFTENYTDHQFKTSHTAEYILGRGRGYTKTRKSSMTSPKLGNTVRCSQNSPDFCLINYALS